MAVEISPSILSADFANFAASLDLIDTADMAHVDVMDNHFVPNLTFGLPVVRRLQEVSPIRLDLHLMIDDPDRWAPRYAQGVYSVTFHAEAAKDAVATARSIRSMGARAGIALKPSTPSDDVVEHLDEFDQILIMTVEPGFGGQSFMPGTMPKLARVAAAVRESGYVISLQVDGGITRETAATSVRNGATCLVAGSSVFGASDPAMAISDLRAAARAASQ